jgi:hypothetical protein
MKGIYLNDIPMDLFLKYFSKDDLVDKDLEPSLLPDFRTFYKYSFSISAQTRYFYSLLPIAKSTEIKENIILDLQDLYSNTLDTNSVGTLTLVSTLTNEKVYVQTNRIALNNHRYFFQYDQDYEDNVNPFYFIEVDGTLNGDLADSDEITIKDSRTNADILGFEVDIVKEESPSGVVIYNVYETGSEVLVGFIYEHRRNFIQELNSLGQSLFLNEFGTKTTNSRKESSFLRHNSAIRKGFNNIVDPLDLIVLKFRPSVLGIYKRGEEEILAYYENFTRTFSYEKINLVDIQSGTPIDTIRIPQNIKSGITSSAPSNFDVNFRESKLKEVLNFFNVKRVKVVKNGDFYETINASELLNTADKNVFAEIYQKNLKYRDISYPVFKLASNNTKEYVKFLGISELSNLNLEIVSLLGINYVRLPVLSGRKIVFDSNKSTVFQNNDTFVTFESNRYKIEPGISNSIYSRGFILYRVELFFERDTNNLSYFGKITDLTNSLEFISKFKLTKYVPESSEIAPINITDEYFDLSGFTAVGNTFEKEYYLQDEIDNTYILKVDEVISKDAINTTIPRTEFLDFFHTKRTSGSGSNTFQLLDGSFIARGSAVSWPITEATLRQLFENYRVVNNFYNNRGPFISDKVFENLKKNAIATMTSDFLNKSSEFFAIENIFYDENSTTIKMRVYSESFKTVISNNNFLYDTILKRTSNISIQDDAKIILEKIEGPLLSGSVVKLYQPEDFTKQVILAQAETNNLNSFQKLLDYESIPYNEKRTNILYEQKKREQIFADKDDSQDVKDDIIIYDRVPKTNVIPRLTFKGNIISLLTEFFFRSSSYIEDSNFYINSYYNFYKDKMDSLGPVYTIEEAEPTYKNVYDRSSLDANINQIFDKLLKKDETWRVL